MRVCERCGEWSDELVVVDDAVVCAHCGHGTPFLRRPLFQVTGASGAGKTAVWRPLVAALPECVVLDQDATLCGLDWETHRRTWLNVAAGIHQGGRSTVLVATQLPEHYAELPERRWFAAIHFAALVCSPEALEQRLRARPAWRGVTDDSIAEMQRFNARLTENGEAEGMTVLDTTSATPAQTARDLHDWVHARL